MGFKLTDRIGFSPPLQLTVVHEEGFYEKHIDFEKLKVALKEANPNPYEIFDYHDFVSHKMVSLKLKDRESGEVHTAEYLTTVPFSVTRDDGEVEELILYGRLNKKIGDVRTDITISRLRIDGKKRLTHYSFLFVYKNFDARVNTSDRDDIHRVAIEVKAIFYEHF